MARPAKIAIQSGLASWDGDLNDDLDIIFDAPFPVFQDTTARTLAGVEAQYPPASYDRCIYSQNLSDGTLSGYFLLLSNGTNWKVLPK